MLEKVLAIGRTVFHSSDEFHELDVHAVNSKVAACPLSGFKYLILKLSMYLAHYLLDACRVESSVDYALVASKSCNLPPDRVEC